MDSDPGTPNANKTVSVSHKVPPVVKELFLLAKTLVPP